MKHTHPLHSVEFFVSQMRGQGFADLERRTGRTTILALGFLQEAMSCPRKPIRVSDHHGTAQADVMCLETALNIAHSAGLDHFYRWDNNSIVFGRPL